MLKTVFFDLDGSLLPMDQEQFTRAYFKALVTKLYPLGRSPDKLVEGVWKGTGAMVKNDGSKTNEQAFWDAYAAFFGPEARADEPHFTEFYETDFEKAREVCGFDPEAPALIRALKELGIARVLASNPIFPMIAQRRRMLWAGLDPADFRHITSYENSRFCKPNPLYFRELLAELSLAPEECLMVGNDATEDLAAAAAGMRVFLLTPCLINKDGRDISECPQGTLSQVLPLVQSLMAE